MTKNFVINVLRANLSIYLWVKCRFVLYLIFYQTSYAGCGKQFK